MSKFTDNLTTCDRISSTDDRDRILQHITMYGIFRWNVPGKGGF